MTPIEDWEDPLCKLGVRPTYRTLRVLTAIGEEALRELEGRAGG